MAHHHQSDDKYMAAVQLIADRQKISYTEADARFGSAISRALTVREPYRKKPTLSEPTQAKLRELFSYSDGHLFWRADGWRHNAGDRASWILKKRGCYFVHFDGRNIPQDKLILLYHHGVMPQRVIHSDGNKRNDRIENLRVSNISECNRLVANKPNKPTNEPDPAPAPVDDSPSVRSLTDTDIETLFDDHLGQVWYEIKTSDAKIAELEQRVQYLEQMVIKIASGK